MKVVQAILDDADNIARIHYNNFKNAFLCSLGLDFLKLLYNWILKANEGFGYIIKDNKNAYGFITGVYDSSGLISLFIKKNFNKAMPILVLGCIRKPKNIEKMFETVLYSKKSDVNIKAELLSIAIEKSLREKGYGNKLFSCFIRNLKRKGIKIFKITVNRNNITANKFYIKCGCELVGTYKMYGKFSNIYKYEIK